MSKSKIEWTDAVWNPTTGCSKVSAGCANCYAEREWHRLAGNPKTTYYGRKFNEVACHPERLDQPLQWKRPRKIFVNSMSDLFHEDVPDGFIDKVFAVMSDAAQHTFMILTKRPDRMMKYLSPDNPRYTAKEIYYLTKKVAGKFDCDLHWPLPNVWLGVSVENQAAADERIPLLLQTRARMRFISVEPLLGPVDLSPWLGISRYEEGAAWARDTGADLDWVITGGESGPGARPMHPYWVQSLRDQCQTAGVPYFFKQWGAWEPIEEVECGILDDNIHRLSLNIIIGIEGTSDGEGWNGTVSSPEMIKDRPLWHLKRVGKKKAGRELDGRMWDELPEVQA